MPVPAWRGAALARLGRVAALLALLLVPAVGTDYFVVLATEVLLLSLFALSFNLLFGYTGLLSFGHAAFFAVGGYVTAILLTHGVPVLAAIPAAIAAAAIAAWLLGWFSVRLNEIYFSMLTLAWGMMVYTVVYQWREVTGGSDGITNLPVRPLLGLALADFRVFYVLALAVVVLCVWLLWRVVHSPFGLMLVAIRENAERIAFAGLDVRRYQLAAFVTAGLFAGAAGALFSPFARIAAPSMAHWTRSAEPVLMTILGGPGSFWGPIVGAGVFIFLRNWVTAQTEYWSFVLGLILLPMVLVFRGGIVGFLRDLTTRAAAPRVAPLPHHGTHADAAPGAPAGSTPAKAPAAEAAATPPPGSRPPAAAHDTPPAPVLELRGLVRTFGALRAVDDVSLTIAPGTFTSIIGPNGAGKTTLYNLVTGRIPPSDGQVFFQGQPITGLAPHRIARRGLARSFQVTNVFMGMSVFENVRAAVIAHRGTGYRWFQPLDADRAIADQSWALLAQVGMAEFAHVPCRALSHGDRRIVEVAIVLALEPALILLDEPTAGMNPAESARIVDLLQRIQRATGKTFLLTEHDMKVVFSVSDRIVVMHQGRVLADGLPAEIRANDEVKRAYLGGVVLADTVPLAPPMAAHATGQPPAAGDGG